MVVSVQSLLSDMLNSPSSLLRMLKKRSKILASECNSMVECQPSKLFVAGSSPVIRSKMGHVVNGTQPGVVDIL